MDLNDALAIKIGQLCVDTANEVEIGLNNLRDMEEKRQTKVSVFV